MQRIHINCMKRAQACHKFLREVCKIKFGCATWIAEMPQASTLTDWVSILAFDMQPNSFNFLCKLRQDTKTLTKNNELSKKFYKHVDLCTRSNKALSYLDKGWNPITLGDKINWQLTQSLSVLKKLQWKQQV